MFIMVGAFTALTMFQAMGIPPVFAIPVAFLIGMALGMLPWVLFGLFWMWIYRGGGGKWAARKAMKVDPRVDRLQRHIIDDEGLHADTGSGSISLPWSGMSQVAETDQHFLWYWHAQNANYTPKAALTDAQIEVLRELILTHAPERAQLSA